MNSITAEVDRQAHWRRWLAEHLPAELAARITGVVMRGVELVIFTESAGWGVRLRYGMAELREELARAAPTVAHVTVRVLPRSGPHTK